MPAVTGQKVYAPNGTEWVVYLEEVMVPCVRLTRFDGTSNVYQDVPVDQFTVINNEGHF